MKKPCYLFSIILLMLALGCKKEDNNPSPSQTVISGTWNVDSVEIVNYENNIPQSKAVEITWPHSLDFSLPNLVVQNEAGNRDTAIFLHTDPNYALSDLDFNNETDTTYILLKIPNTSIELEWTGWRDTFNGIEYKTVNTMYISK